MNEKKEKIIKPDAIIVKIEGSWEREAVEKMMAFFKDLMNGGKNSDVLLIEPPSKKGRISWSPIWKDIPGDIQFEEKRD